MNNELSRDFSKMQLVRRPDAQPEVPVRPDNAVFVGTHHSTDGLVHQDEFQDAEGNSYRGDYYTGSPTAVAPEEPHVHVELDVSPKKITWHTESNDPFAATKLTKHIAEGILAGGGQATVSQPSQDYAYQQPTTTAYQQPYTMPAYQQAVASQQAPAIEVGYDDEDSDLDYDGYEDNEEQYIRGTRGRRFMAKVAITAALFSGFAEASYMGLTSNHAELFSSVAGDIHKINDHRLTVGLWSIPKTFTHTIGGLF